MVRKETYKIAKCRLSQHKGKSLVLPIYESDACK